MEKKALEQLIEKCKQKNEDAFQILYKEYYPVSYRLAFHISKSHADANDIAQETMIAVYDYIAHLRSSDVFVPWLKRITVSKCNRLFRKNKHVTYVEDEDLVMKMPVDYKRANNPEQTIHFENDKEVLYFFIRQLPEKQAEILCMYYFDQLNIREISDQLQIPDGTVKSRMLLGKKQLRKSVSSYESRDNIHLDFKSDAILGMIGSGSLLSLGALRQACTSMFSSGSSIMLVTTGVILSTCGIFAIQDYIEKEQQQTIPNSPLMAPTTQSPQKSFASVAVAGMEINNAQDAYFKILLWADQSNQLNYKSVEEVEQFKILLNSLKSYGGPYYSSIMKLDWVEKLANY